MEFSSSLPIFPFKREANESGFPPNSFSVERTSLPSKSSSNVFLRHLVEKEIKEAQEWLHSFFSLASDESGGNDFTISNPFCDKNSRAFFEDGVNHKMPFFSSVPFSLLIGPPRWHQKSASQRGSLKAAAENVQKEFIGENRGDTCTCATGGVHPTAANSIMTSTFPRTSISKKKKNFFWMRKDDHKSTAGDSFSSFSHNFSQNHFFPLSAGEEETDEGSEDENYFSITIRLSRPFISFSLLQAAEAAGCSLSAEKKRCTGTEACRETEKKNTAYCSIYDKSNSSVPSQRHSHVLSQLIHTFPCAEVTCYVEVQLTTSYLQGHSSHCKWWCGEDFFVPTATFSCCPDKENQENEVHAGTFHACCYAEHELGKNMAKKEAAFSLDSSNSQWNPVSAPKRFCASSHLSTHCFLSEDKNDRRGVSGTGEQQKRDKEKNRFEKKEPKRDEERTEKEGRRPLIADPPPFPFVFAARGGVMEGCEDFSIAMRDDAATVSFCRSGPQHAVCDVSSVALPSPFSSPPSALILAPHAVERLLASVRKRRGWRNHNEKRCLNPLREDTFSSSVPYKEKDGPSFTKSIPRVNRPCSTSSSSFFSSVSSSFFLRELVWLVDAWLRLELDDQDIKGGPGVVTNATALSAVSPFQCSSSFPHSRLREEVFPTLSSSHLSRITPLRGTTASTSDTSAVDECCLSLSTSKTKNSPFRVPLRFPSPPSLSVSPVSAVSPLSVQQATLLQGEEGISEWEGKTKKRVSNNAMSSTASLQHCFSPTFFIKPYGGVFLPHGGVLYWGSTSASTRKIKETVLPTPSEKKQKTDKKETSRAMQTPEAFSTPWRQKKKDKGEEKTHTASTEAMATLPIDKNPSSCAVPFSVETSCPAAVPPSPFPSVLSSTLVTVKKKIVPIYFRTTVSSGCRMSLPSLMWPHAILPWSAADAAFFTNCRRECHSSKRMAQSHTKERDGRKSIELVKRKNTKRREEGEGDGEKKWYLPSFYGDRNVEEGDKRRVKRHAVHRADYYYAFFIALLHRWASGRVLRVPSIFFNSFPSTSAAAASAVTWLYHARLYAGGNIAETLRCTAIHYCRALGLSEEEHMILALSTLAESTSSASATFDYPPSPSIEVVLWPALEETINVLQSRQLSFLAGVILCNVVLPLVLLEPVYSRGGVAPPSIPIFPHRKTDDMECVGKTLLTRLEKSIDETPSIPRGREGAHLETNSTHDRTPAFSSMLPLPPFSTEEPALSPTFVWSSSRTAVALPPFTNWCTCYLAVSFVERVLKILMEWFSLHTCPMGPLSPMMVASVRRISTMTGEARIVRRALEMSATQAYFSSSCRCYDWKDPWIPLSREGSCFLKRRREPISMFRSSPPQGAPRWMMKGWHNTLCDPVHEFEPPLTYKTGEERRITIMKDGMEEENQRNKRIAGVPLVVAKKKEISPFKDDLFPFPDITIPFSVSTSSFHALPFVDTCAVCGESILLSEKRVVLDKRDEHVLEEYEGSTRGSTKTYSLCKGSLILQCTRCGHGGHVDHVSNWWKYSPVQQCPQGCGCHCSY